MVCKSGIVTEFWQPSAFCELQSSIHIMIPELCIYCIKQVNKLYHLTFNGFKLWGLKLRLQMPETWMGCMKSDFTL